MLVFDPYVSAQAESHGADAVGINKEALLFESLQCICRGRDRKAAAWQIPAQDLQGTVHKNGKKGPLVRPWFCGQVPKIGVEGKITGGPHKPDQFPIRLIQDADLPEAALKGELPAFLRVG